jgi:hypothetical protein
MGLAGGRVACRLRLDDARSCLLLRRASWKKREGGEGEGMGGGMKGDEVLKGEKANMKFRRGELLAYSNTLPTGNTHSNVYTYFDCPWIYE